MKNLSFAFLLFLLLSGCTNSGLTSDKEVITVSIEPFSFFVKEIAGSAYEVNIIVPSGASPATYEPPPSVVRSMSKSDMLVINGYLGFEMAWIDRLIKANPDVKTLKLSDNQDLIAADSHRHGDIIHYTGVDPHFWISPVAAAIIARDIRDFLISNYPERKEVFSDNYIQLDSIIRHTDKYVSSIIEKSGAEAFMIFHPSLTYLARDYGLEQIPVEMEGKEPSPSELKRLIDKGRERQVDAIFVQREFDRTNADLIAREIGVEAIVIDPLSSDWVNSVSEIAEYISGEK